ncbi:hypothetical protein PISMIDRAFT_20384 [Pisolithus microcarpus 441]|uniref:Uncharacterized protein n=1 Tax=Pisolithus microcarpus 441 TaxID=765257 RepID=A0A0C9XDV5_9AGAM|nr:hypothetical protein PISMIDRAFT_20384 [Pisolithus microcarpus 441]
MDLRSNTLNLRTYKLHALGDYTTTIRMFGTSDSYSMQSGEREHQVGKGRFVRTNRKDFVRQLARIERRQARIRKICDSFKATRGPFEPVPNKPEERYNVGKSQHRPIDIADFIRKHSGDPALQDFVPKLKNHLLPHVREMHALASEPTSSQPLWGLEASYSTSEAAADHLLFKGNRIYQHCVLRVNYTTYDVKRGQDIFNPTTDHHDVMMLATPENADKSEDTYERRHCFCYARIIGIYHANVQYIGPGFSNYLPRRLDFLHVRWFEQVAPNPGDGSCRLDVLRFPPMNDRSAFDFIDPASILQGCHLIPAFAKGRSHSDHTSLSPVAKDSDDWNYYYINRLSEI